ncbi:YeaH/YhbH family protein [Candidatus Halocynthiibacter alkanivorans]|jgi:uncharacterized protein|uniref:YeaH/YhbH family protein n=1 Tax=Candidatus Halocynthiibacter alkanivorans TaxID=2267619 RepID=UPI000DF30259|nr:YeaH/YhbH family protein [Candidatus Halocynthiibacter alkanivorans]
MHHFIDRRPNPAGKSLGNRQRFLRRARHHIKDIVDKSVRERSVSGRNSRELAQGERVTIPVKGIKEPRLVHSNQGGMRQRVFPGNKEFVVGDSFPRPKSGQGGGGKKASEDGEGEDGFSFSLTREEYLEMLFEGLELPDLVKKNLIETKTISYRRAGITTAGTPSNLNLLRTMRNSLGRRIALQRPSLSKFNALKARIEELEALEAPCDDEFAELEELRQQLGRLERKRKVVGFIDPVDLRFDTHLPEIVLNSKAVVFCLMDVSGSMQEREKDLAKRFFILLNLFLERCYEHTEIVFVCHTQHAREVDEDTFFYSRETGGTVVSSALTEMLKIIKDRYPTDEWNIYGAQASDGENFGNDSEKCQQLLQHQLLPLCQYYAYVEILSESDEVLMNDPEQGADLWQACLRVKKRWPSFEMQRVCSPADIYPVFRALFAPRTAAAVAP